MMPDLDRTTTGPGPDDADQVADYPDRYRLTPADRDALAARYLGNRIADALDAIAAANLGRMRAADRRASAARRRHLRLVGPRSRED